MALIDCKVTSLVGTSCPLVTWEDFIVMHLVKLLLSNVVINRDGSTIISCDDDCSYDATITDIIPQIWLK